MLVKIELLHWVWSQGIQSMPKNLKKVHIYPNLPEVYLPEVYLAKKGGEARAFPEFGRSVNPIQIRGADYAPHTTAPPSPPIQKAIYTY